MLEPERLAAVMNSYLSEMASIAINCGGTIDKFIGDAVLVFFGDPETEGETEDALKCIEMAIQMQIRVRELQKFWAGRGVPQQINVRMGIATGFCTVGNFGSEQRLDYTAVGRPVNLAARLQGIAEPTEILVDENTKALICSAVNCKFFKKITPKGFARSIKVYQATDFISKKHRIRRKKLFHSGKRVEVNVIDSSDIRAVIEELGEVQKNFEEQTTKNNSPNQDKS